MRKAGFTFGEVRDFAMSEKAKWRKGKRDALEKQGRVVNVTLWGNRIASYNPKKGRLAVSSAGWETNTTKARLNKLLPSGFGVSQRNFNWFLTTPRGTSVPFKYERSQGYGRGRAIPFSLKVGSAYMRQTPVKRAVGQLQQMIMKRKGVGGY